MTKLHEENFYSYQNQLLDDADLVMPANPQIIPRQPEQSGGVILWESVSLRTGVARPLGGRAISGPTVSGAAGTTVSGATGTTGGGIRAAFTRALRRAPVILTDATFVSAVLSANHWLDAVRNWQLALSELQSRRHGNAADALVDCQRQALHYFGAIRGIAPAGVALQADVLNVATKISALDPTPGPPRGPNSRGYYTLSTLLAMRRNAAGTAALHDLDWVAPRRTNAMVLEPIATLQSVTRLNANCLEVIHHIAAVGIDAKLQPHMPLVHQKLDYFMMVLITVLVPLARAELERDRRNYTAAVAELDWVLANFASAGTPAQYFVNEAVELPFIRLLLAECLMDQGDADYRSETPATPLPSMPAPPARVVRHDWMKARSSYERVVDALKPLGGYDTHVLAAVAKLSPPAGAGAPDLNKLAKEILIPSIKPALRPGEAAAPGQERMVLLKNAPAAAPLLQIGDATSKDTNPRVFALLLTAYARLEQLKANFNWLGYRDDYTPPWRFQFLLERARYFAEHAKQAQRDYLNFLSNAEREELQEKSAAQTVALETANIAVESARVDQASAQHLAAQKGHELAEMAATNATTRAAKYLAFDEIADDQSNTPWYERALGVFGQTASGFATGGKVGAVAGFIGGLTNSWTGELAEDRQNLIQSAHRDYEYTSLDLAAGEALKAVEVADQEQLTAAAAVTVANLQRQAALLRHEFAVETAAYLVNRKLNAEQWFRLANGIRVVAETYLRYAIEIAFLAEQAYEFEADKLLNLIRFDYDASELGDYLAGDFLLRDLDTLEQDLIVSQREREQHVRYVLSMSREFPEALQELRDTGRLAFSMVLQQIERRFPGLILARLGAVDVLPIALMDQTRFSLRLTHLGFSRMRRRPTPGADPEAPWPAAPRVHGPETTIFSGLSRQDAASLFPIATSGQRNAFEGRGAAGAWEIDMSMEENQVVPGSLADMLITFNISGYFDANVQTEPPMPGPNAISRYISARQVFPDNFFEFNRTGKMDWPITADLLTTADQLGKVRNVGVLVVPARSRQQHRRYTATGVIEFTVAEDGTPAINPDTLPPAFSFKYPDAAKPLRIAATLATTNVEASWDPGDGSPMLEGPAFDHEYARPGVYKVTLRIVRGERLQEYRCEIAVARDVLLGLPLVAVPELVREAQAPPGKRSIRVRAHFPSETGQTNKTAMSWHVIGLPGARRTTAAGVASNPNEAVLDLPITLLAQKRPFLLAFRAVRSQDVWFYSRQRYKREPNQALPMAALNLATNRRYDSQAPALNDVAKHFFGEPPTAVFSPIDTWTFELPRSENGQQMPGPFSGPDSRRGSLRFDGAQIEDLVLTLEYETGPAG
jgi:hypothetical protein